MKAEDVHFHALKLFSFPLAAKESSRSVLHETRLTLAQTRDIRRNKVFGANSFPRFADAGCCEGPLALNTSGEGLLFVEQSGGRRTAGYGGRGDIKKLMGGHAQLFPVGGAFWGETRLELHGGGIGRRREGII